MKSILLAFAASLSLLACAAEPAPPPVSVDESSATAAPEELALAEDATTCTGTVRCACFVTSPTGAERKVTGSDFTGVCDATDRCAPTCAQSQCTRGTAKSTGHSCRIATP